MKPLTSCSATIDTIAVIANDRIERMTLRNAGTSYLLLDVGRNGVAEICVGLKTTCWPH